MNNLNTFYNKGEDYDIPSTSNYMRWEEGDNRFRILGAFSEGTAIQGIEYWKTDEGKRKPVRLKKGETVPVSELEVNQFGEPDRPKFFWAFPVWNYQEKKVQILEITQVTILNYIKKVIDNPKWGDPREYDFIVSRGKEGGKTVYTVTNDPKEKLDTGILAIYKNIPINIQALFSGEDPFTSNEEKIDVDEVDKEIEQQKIKA